MQSVETHVHLVRDGRAVALTYRNPNEYADARDPQRRGGGGGSDRSQPVRSMRSAAREWRRRNEEAQCILRELDASRWISVRYETLCADVDGTLEQIFRHFRLDPDRRLGNFRERWRAQSPVRLRLTAAMIELRRSPYPYRAMLAICSDLDETPDRQTYWEIMRFLNTAEPTRMGAGVNLEVANTINFDMPPSQFAYWNTDDAGRHMVRTLIGSGHVDCLHS